MNLLNRLSHLSLRNKLLFSYALLLAITLTILGVVTFYSSAGVIKEQLRLSMTEVITQARNNLTSYMSDVETVLFSLNNNNVIQNILLRPSPQREFDLSIDLLALENQILRTDLFRRKTSSVQLFALAKDNYPLFNHATYGNIFSDRGVTDQSWFKATLRLEGKTYWQGAHHDFISGKEQVSALRLIKSLTNPYRPLGVVKANIDLNVFLSAIDRIKLGKSGKAFLIQNNRIVGDNKSWLAKNLTADSVFFQAIGQTVCNGLFMKIKGTEYLVVFDGLEGVGWKLVGVIPSLELTEGNTRLIGKVTLLTWIISLIIAFLFSALIAIWISKPLIDLAQVMKSFNTNLEMRVAVNSGDEIGLLHNSFNKMMGRIGRLVGEINEISRREKDAELKALQAQINPHFLYNTLESINWLALKYEAKDISLMVTSLGKFLRHSLNKGQELISIANELEQVQSYLAIQKFRFANQFSVTFAVPPALNSYTIVKLVLQPLVENAIIHGFQENADAGEIWIEGYQEGEYIVLLVKDNGLGTDTELLNLMLSGTIQHTAPLAEKYGIYNVDQRLKLYFGAECGLYFSGNEWGGVTVAIRIKAQPFNAEFQKPGMPG